MSDEDSYGPTLPPSMRIQLDGSQKRKSVDESESSGDDDSYGPALPPSMRRRQAPTVPNVSGDGTSAPSTGQAPPPSPPTLVGPTRRPVSPPAAGGSGDSSSDADAYGPALPPSAPTLVGPTRRPVSPPLPPPAAGGGDSSSDDDAYGPSLPPGFPRRPAVRAVKGPALPPGGLPAADREEDGSDEDIIGPLPPAHGVDLGQYAAADLERRASSMKDKLDDAGRPAELVREEWMLELPPERAGEFGLGPRQFRRTTPAERGDTSGWTDVNPDKQAQPKKPKDRATPVEDPAVRRRDERMAEVAEALQANRQDSLLDIHQQAKCVKKEADHSDGKRREFDRDHDMGTNRFDDAQRATAIKRSRGASDMFSSGSQKYL